MKIFGPSLIYFLPLSFNTFRHNGEEWKFFKGKVNAETNFESWLVFPCLTKIWRALIDSSSSIWINKNVFIDIIIWNWFVHFWTKCSIYHFDIPIQLIMGQSLVILKSCHDGNFLVSKNMFLEILYESIDIKINFDLLVSLGFDGKF